MARTASHVALTLTALCAFAPATAKGDDGGKDKAGGPLVDFKEQILPVFHRACVKCHGPEKASGGLQLVTGAKLLAGGVSGKALVPGNAKESYLFQRIVGDGGEDRMPLKDDPLSEQDTALVRRWIAEGAVIPTEPPPVFIPAPAGIKRLTVAQYRATVKALFGDAVTQPPDIEQDTLINGSAAVGATKIVLSGRATEQFGLAAFQIARQALSAPSWRNEWIPCAPALTEIVKRRKFSPDDETCLETFVTRFGRRLWRRALAPAERARYVRLGRAVSTETNDLRRGFEAVLGGLLQSPWFIYRVEIGVTDPKDPKHRILTDFEMASRLSYFMWGSPPDDALLDAAEAGKLSTDDGLRIEAERMLTSPRAKDTMKVFFVELLRLRRLDRLQQFRSKFAMASSRTLGQSMRTETLKVIEEIAFNPQRDFREIFDSKFTYVNGELARLYGLPVPKDENQFTRVELPASSPRSGVLGHASFLALNAHPTASSPTKRGKFIREVLLCQAVPPPPPNVSTKLPEDHEGAAPRTTRQKLDGHRTAPQCNGCHKAMDPMGLAFEAFDGIGAFRDKENGLPIDTSGELDGVPFKHAGELGTLLRGSSKVGVCIARGLFRYAMGHLETEGEEPLVQELALGLENDGYKFGSLILAVVKSRGFRQMSQPE